VHDEGAVRSEQVAHLFETSPQMSEVVRETRPAIVEGDVAAPGSAVEDSVGSTGPKGRVEVREGHLTADLWVVPEASQGGGIVPADDAYRGVLVALGGAEPGPRRDGGLATRSRIFRGKNEEGLT